MYVDELLGEITEIKEYAALVEKKFDNGGDPAALLMDAQLLERRLRLLEGMMPVSPLAGDPFRRTQWMVFYLKKGNTEGCRSDIVGLTEFDLPAIEKQVRDWSADLAYMDAELRRELSPLIRTKQFDSAIRKAFVILKSRLCKKFSLSEQLDGPDLVNQLFGRGSSHLQEMEAGKRQALRDLFAGLFGLLRNEFAHNNLEASVSDLDAVVTNVNLCLRLVGDFRKIEIGISAPHRRT